MIALGGTRPWRRSPAIVDGARRIVSAMRDVGPKRLVYLSALGVAESRADTGALVRRLIIPLVLRGAYADHATDEARIRASGLDWTIVRPTNLTRGPATGRFKSGPHICDRFPIGRISRADVAREIVGLLEEERGICEAIHLVA